MRLSLRILAVCLGALIANSAFAGGDFYNLGDTNFVTGLSADGSVAAGSNFNEYFYWTAMEGVVLIGGQAAGGGVGGQAKMSNDGMRISGTSLSKVSGWFEMSYYDRGTGMWNPLGGIGATCPGGPGEETSSGWGISNNGMSVVGLGWFQFCGPAHAIQWDQSSGMTNDLGSTVLDRSSRANGTNMDGSVVIGWQDRMDGFRQGAVWDNGVQTVILTPGGEPVSEASDVDMPGNWVVGIGGFATTDEAWRWSPATGVEQLGMDCPNCFLPRGFATGISNDGSVIVGFNREFPFGQTIGWVWTEDMGMVRLNDLAAAAGIDTGGLDLAQPLIVSGDGLTIAGTGLPPGGFFPTIGFVITFEEDVPMQAALDIKPGSCPNPYNPKSQGYLPVALLGSGEFDVSMVNLSTVMLSRADGVGIPVAPHEGPPGPHTVIADVGTPFKGETCDCHEEEGDGTPDLSMKFKRPDVTAALQLDGMPGGTPVELVLSGLLLDGTDFEARDCVILVPVGDFGEDNSSGSVGAGGDAPVHQSGMGTKSRPGRSAR